MRQFALVFLVLASGALAQDLGTAPADHDDTVVVTGRRGSVLRSYLDQVARPETGRQLARWNAPLCVKYDGLDKKFAAFIQARIATIASDVGLKLAGPNCPTAILVKLTDQADALARAMVNRTRPPVGSLTSGNLLPKRVIKAIEAPQTVRWLTASATVNSEGIPINDGVNQIWSASLIASPTREDIHSKIIIIDALRLANVSLNQLADYIAFVTLASPDVSADFSGTDSIMALFADTGSKSAKLTQQDRAFLEALYRAPANRPASVQRRTIRARIASRTGEQSTQDMTRPD